MPKKHVRLDFSDDLTLSNQKTRRTKEMPEGAAMEPPSMFYLYVQLTQAMTSA